MIHFTTLDGVEPHPASKSVAKRRRAYSDNDFSRYMLTPRLVTQAVHDESDNDYFAILAGLAWTAFIVNAVMSL